MDRLQGESAFSFLNVLERGDYFGLLAYLPPDDATFDPVLREFRMRVAARTGWSRIVQMMERLPPPPAREVELPPPTGKGIRESLEIPAGIA